MSACSDVRCADEVRRSEQLAIDRRLGGEHIKCGAGEPALDQCRGDGGLVDNPAPCRIDEICGSFHRAQLVGTNQPSRGRIERNVHGHDIRLLEQRAERYRLHAVLPVEFVVRANVVREDGGAERTTQSSDLLADVAASQDAYYG